MTGFTSELLVTIGVTTISALIVTACGMFILAQNPRRTLNWLFFFLTTSTALASVVFSIASLQTTHDTAYFWSSLTILTVLVPPALVHFIFCVINRQREWLWFIVFTYFASASILFVAWLYPTLFIPDVVPKLYFTYYLEGGWWFVVMLAECIFLPLIAVGNLLHAHHRSLGVERQRLEYLILMLAVGFAIGCLNFLLAFNVPFDPLFVSFASLYLLPIAYGIFSTKLVDIHSAFKSISYYVVIIGGLTIFLIILNGIDTFLLRTVPGFQFWIVPLITATIAFIVWHSILTKAQESEKIKYEFITVATHKLRTPLTRIRWVIPELLAKAGADAGLREGISRIDDANNRLIELTNVLMESTNPGGIYDYQKVSVDLRHLAWEAVKHFTTQIGEKKLVVTVDASNPPHAEGDTRRLTLVIEVLVENAIMYTPARGTIHITIAPERHGVLFAVRDSGIGVNHEDQQHIFSSFYRTNAARTADTEGVGLGLSLAKNIIERQGGEIGVTSEGEGRGSTFWFTMPIINE